MLLLPGEENNNQEQRNPISLDDIFKGNSTDNQYYKMSLNYLQSIDNSLKSIVGNGKNMSQASARERLNQAKEEAEDNVPKFFRKQYQNKEEKKSKAPKSFSAGIGEALTDAVLGSDFKDQIGKSMSDFAKLLGGEVSDIPGILGKEIGKQGLNALKKTNIGKSLFGKLDNFKANTAQRIQQASQAFNQGFEKTTGKSPEEVIKENTAEKVEDAKRPASQTPSGSTQQTTDASQASNPVSDVANTVKDIASDKIEDELMSQVKDKAISFAKDKGGQLLGKLAGKGGKIGSLAGKASSFLGLGGKAAATAGATSTAAAGTAAATTAATGTAAATTAGTAAAGTAAAGALSGVVAAASAVVPPLLALAAAMVILEAVTQAIAPALEGFKNLMGSLSKAANRDAAEREKRQKNEQERFKADIETMVKYPFEILSKAADELYQAWDANIRKINGTQGYSKEDLADLMGSYAERLRNEGLSRVVSTANITENLAKVLDSGLSGVAAEEFAYLATILNAAIPTQDFFSYADTYVSLAAQAQAAGKSQAESLDYANQQIENFASSILYASRQLTGGFTTGLKDAQSILESATKIAQTSRTGNPSEIAAVLTAVSAYTGSIAPDLATSMTEAIVSAATGGNSSQLVALRSMAGINASNTEFLQQLASNPQKVLSDMFTGLADMQKMSDENYMEVAEALSDVFGVSMEAFARIDFNSLAEAIRNMNMSATNLSENMAHLASGETTTTAEQLKMQQINQYMIDEGLAYVLDNEAARTIQEHMWDEQMKNELMENTFAVELKGAALDFLEGIRQTIDNIVGLLNPFSWIGKIFNMAATAQEGYAQEADLRQFLELGKVGQGNVQSLYQLTTRGVDLNVTPDIVTLMGGTSMYQMVESTRKLASSIFNLGTNNMWLADNLVGAAAAITQYNMGSNFASRGNAYTWGGIGKSSAAALQGSGVPSGQSYSGTAIQQASATSAGDANITAINNALEKLTDKEYVESFAKNNKSYDEWIKTASNFGIANLDEALSAVGRDESELEALYQQYQTAAGAQREIERQQKEETFWEIVPKKQDEQKELMNVGNDLLQQILDTNKAFRQDFTDYFIDHVYYDKSGYDYSAVERVRFQEASGEQEAIYALAEALTQNTVDLRDPTVQTNAILAQILIVVKAIMQQNNTTGKLTIPDSIAAMAAGMFTLED